MITETGGSLLFIIVLYLFVSYGITIVLFKGNTYYAEVTLKEYLLTALVIVPIIIIGIVIILIGLSQLANLF